MANIRGEHQRSPSPTTLRICSHGVAEWSRLDGMGQLDDVRLSFNAVADVYDAVRPSYPPVLFDAMFQLLPSEPEIVEVGPGTGQATRELLARGASVHAIELGPAMASRLRSNLPLDRLRVTVADFEDADIPAASADAVFAATAYHWITAPAQLNRPASILRPGGLIAIFDLIQVDSPDDSGFFSAVQPVYERNGQGHFGSPAPTRVHATPPIHDRLAQDDRFKHVSLHSCDWDQTYTASDYRKLMLSYSGTQSMNEHDRIRLLDDIEAIVEQDFDGRVVRPIVATLTSASLA